jgi:hypothetical protein
VDNGKITVVSIEIDTLIIKMMSLEEQIRRGHGARGRSMRYGNFE